MAPSTPSLQGERGSEEKLSLLLLVPMPCIAVDDACYVSALLLMPLLVCLPWLTLFFRVWFLPYLLPCSQGFCVLPYLLPCSQGFCVLLCALCFRVCSCVSAANFALVCHLFHLWLTKRPSLQLVLLKYGVLWLACQVGRAKYLCPTWGGVLASPYLVRISVSYYVRILVTYLFV